MVSVIFLSEKLLESKNVKEWEEMLVATELKHFILMNKSARPATSLPAVASRAAVSP
jgi:hypothetical protein